MMKNIAVRLLPALLFLAPLPALAQSSGKVVADCAVGVSPAYPLGSNSVPTVNAQGQNCITGSISASLSGFAPVTTGTPITATTGGATGTLPAGAVVAVFNTGATNTAYCKLGASSTTSDIAIQPGSWFAYTVGAATQLTCITSTSTTTVNMVGGSGLPTGAGGGGGSGGGGGAVTVADGADVTQGAIADAAVASNAAGTVNAHLRAISRDVMTVNTWAGGTLAAMAAYGTPPTGLVPGVNAFVTNTQAAVGNNVDNVAAGASAASPVVNYNYAFDGTTWDRVRAVNVDPCEANVQTYATGVITSATTTRIVAPSASNKTYACMFFTKASAADNVAIVEGTGGTCGTGTAAVLGGTTTANGLVFGTAGDGVLLQAGGKVAAMQTAGTNVDLCLITSTAGPLIYSIKYVQAP
jgi:hypothetical protein